MKLETLQKVKEWATIFALIAVPIIVAVTPQIIQSHASAESLQKDYVTLALGILSKKKGDQPDVELRQWAVEIIDKNSPVPIPQSLKVKLGMGGADFSWLRVLRRDIEEEQNFLPRVEAKPQDKR